MVNVWTWAVRREGGWGLCFLRAWRKPIVYHRIGDSTQRRIWFSSVRGRNMPERPKDPQALAARVCSWARLLTCPPVGDLSRVLGFTLHMWTVLNVLHLGRVHWRISGVGDAQARATEMCFWQKWPLAWALKASDWGWTPSSPGVRTGLAQ